MPDNEIVKYQPEKNLKSITGEEEGPRWWSIMEVLCFSCSCNAARSASNHSAHLGN